MQKSRVDWMRYGDRDTKFFSTSTLVRKRRNKIETVQVANGYCVVEGEALMNMLVDYFLELII